MTRSEVRAFIKSGVDALAPVTQFNNGRVSEFNSETNKQYPYVWMESLSVDSTETSTLMPLDEWNIVLHIAKLCPQDAVPEQYEPLIDECDLLAQKLKAKYNFIVSGFKNVTLSDHNREPFIKKHADSTAGVIMSFNLSSPDTTNNCD
jgi:hypothetical protein